MADLREIEKLITDHIKAVVNHELMFNLNDWGLASDKETSAALDSIDVSLIALCAAQPSDDAAAARRSEYLNAKVPDAIYDNKAMAKEVVAALVGGGNG